MKDIKNNNCNCSLHSHEHGTCKLENNKEQDLYLDYDDLDKEFIIDEKDYKAMLKTKDGQAIENRKIYIKYEIGDIELGLAPEKNINGTNLPENSIKTAMLELLTTDINILKTFTINVLLKIKEENKIKEYIFVDKIEKELLKDKTKDYYSITLKTKDGLGFLLGMIPKSSFDKAQKQSIDKNIEFINIIFDNILYNFEISKDKNVNDLYSTLFFNLTLGKENIDKIESLRKENKKTPQELSNYFYSLLKEEFLNKTYIK